MSYDQMTDAQVRAEHTKALEQRIASLEEVVAAQREVIAGHQMVDAWRSAIQRGDASVEQFEAALELEEAGEVVTPLPKGYVRRPDGRVVAAGEGGETDPTPDPGAPGVDVSETFLGSVGT